MPSVSSLLWVLQSTKEIHLACDYVRSKDSPTMAVQGNAALAKQGNKALTPWPQ